MTEPTRTEERTVSVVVAEDEAIIRMDLKEMLEEEGYDVVGEASDGRKAIELAREHKPDLVILDIKMPGMDGIRAAEVITREKLSAVLILTAFSQRDLAAQAAQAGAMAYLVKPFQKSDLLPAIEVALERHGEVVRLQGQVGELEEKLESRKRLDRAKGMLMDQGLTEAEAYRLMQKAAMDRGMKMNEVAELIIEGRLGEEGREA